MMGECSTCNGEAPMLLSEAVELAETKRAADQMLEAGLITTAMHRGIMDTLLRHMGIDPDIERNRVLEECLIEALKDHRFLPSVILR